ncbi:MAG: hypothetical protein NT028_11510, partial [candidate division Zixibacteria bacterium]|nr:hypothetical protein [candidate division Zixibacteria bacterium]
MRPIVQRVIRKYWFSKREARYHFIHIPKNAGISVRDALTLQRDVSLSTPYHYRYVDIADTVGRHLKFFAVVRNPWSRTASRFHYGRQNSQRWPVNDPRREYISKATFADFVRDQKILPIPEHPGQPWMGPVSSWFNQLEWIRDEAGVVAADCLRLEHLDDDLPVYLQRAIAPRRHNVTHTRYDYRSMYTV